MVTRKTPPTGPAHNPKFQPFPPLLMHQNIPQNRLSVLQTDEPDYCDVKMHGGATGGGKMRNSHTDATIYREISQRTDESGFASNSGSEERVKFCIEEIEESESQGAVAAACQPPPGLARSSAGALSMADISRLLLQSNKDGGDFSSHDADQCIDVYSFQPGSVTPPMRRNSSPVNRDQFDHRRIDSGERAPRHCQRFDVTYGESRSSTNTPAGMMLKMPPPLDDTLEKRKRGKKDRRQSTGGGASNKPTTNSVSVHGGNVKWTWRR